MLSFSGFRLEDGSPIYQQIIRYLEQGDFDGAANALLKHIDNVDVRMLA